MPWCAPEVIRNEKYNLKCDIWSLGCVLYEMITLRPPFRAENMEGLYNKVIKGQIHRIPERFSSDLDTIVRLLIQVHSENRPSCDQILRHPIINKGNVSLNTCNKDCSLKQYLFKKQADLQK